MNRAHRGSLEAFENYCFPCGKRIEASSRLARGSQKPLVFMEQSSSRVARGFRKLLFSLWKTHRGFIEACSRLSKTIGFNLVRAKIATLNISTSNLSLTESVGLRWRLIFVLLTIWLGCVFWDLGTGPGLKFYGVGARPMASPRLTWDSPFSIIKPQVPEASMTLKSFQNHCFYNAKLIEA